MRSSRPPMFLLIALVFSVAAIPPVLFLWVFVSSDGGNDQLALWTVWISVATVPAVLCAFLLFCYRHLGPTTAGRTLLRLVPAVVFCLFVVAPLTLEAAMGQNREMSFAVLLGIGAAAAVHSLWWARAGVKNRGLDAPTNDFG